MEPTASTSRVSPVEPRDSHPGTPENQDRNPPDGGDNDPDPEGGPGDDDPEDPEDIPADNAGLAFVEAISRLSTSIKGLQRPSQGKVKVRDPDTFDGSDPKKLREFLFSCNLHFRDRPSSFSSDEKKILFILSYLKGAAISWFEPGLMDIHNSAPWMWDYGNFINELESNFGPHDLVGDAEKAISLLSMKDNQRIYKYNVEFWKLASRVDWNDAALRERYFRGLPLRLRTKILRYGKPNNLTDMRHKAQNHDDVHWMVKDEADLESRSKTSSSKTSKDSSSNNNNSNKTGNSGNSSTNSGNNKSGNSNKKSDSGKSDKSKKSNQPSLDDKLGKDGKLTSEERDRRFKEGLCLYCGQAGHKSPDCEKAKAAKAQAAMTESSKTPSSGSSDSKKS